jgi:hypothetical protein
MQYRFLGLVLIVATLMAFSCACTEESTEVQTPVPTTAATPVATTPSPAPTQEFSLEPSPTDVVPAYHSVTITVHRNEIAVHPYIAVTFAGGKGQQAVTDLDVTVYLETGEVKTAKLENKIGSEVQIDGSLGTDRVVVYASYTDGTRAKVYDQLAEFGKR